MKKIGLTGNIAAGKSAAEQIIKSIGYKIIDADEIVHYAMENDSEIIEKIKKAFGKNDIVDEKDRLDRGKMGKVAFFEPKYLRKLEDIIHPFAIKKIEEFFNNNNAEELVFASVPLLFEINIQDMFDKVILVSAEENLRLERLMARNNLSKEDAMLRINSQIKEDEKIKKADFVVRNNGSREELAEEVQKIILALRA